MPIEKSDPAAGSKVHGGTDGSAGKGSRVTRRHAINVLRKSAITAPAITLLIAPRGAEAFGGSPGDGSGNPFN